MRQPIMKAAAALCCALGFFAFTSTACRALEIKRTTLPDGAVLLVSEQHQLPMVSIGIAFDAGARRDPAGKAGLSELTASALEQGTRQLTAAQFNQKVDFMGSSVSISADRDFTYAAMTALKKYEEPTLHLLAQALQEPALHDSDILRKRGDQAADIKSSEEDPGYAAMVAFTRQLFGNGPYGHPVEGFDSTVPKLTPDEVRDFYHEYYKMGSAVIAVAGDVQADTIKALLEKELAGLPGRVAPQAAPPAPDVPSGIHPDLINRNVAQANLILGSGGIARSNPDYYRIQVMNYILGGGGFSSRLMKVVRSRAGLAYSIASGFSAAKFPGAFAVVLQTKNESAQQALKLIIGQLHAIQNQPVSENELGAAKKYLVGSFPLRLDRQSQIVSFMLDIQLYGLGLDYADRYPKLINAVTVGEVQQAAQKYVHPDALDLVAVANQSLAKINPAALAEISK